MNKSRLRVSAVNHKNERQLPVVNTSFPALENDKGWQWALARKESNSTMSLTSVVYRKGEDGKRD